MNRNEILAILESFNNRYGATSADRRRALETIMAKKGARPLLEHSVLFEEWANKGTPGSVPKRIIDALCCVPMTLKCNGTRTPGLMDFFERTVLGANNPMLEIKEKGKEGALHTITAADYIKFINKFMNS